MSTIVVLWPIGCKYWNEMGELLKILIIKWVSKQSVRNGKRSRMSQFPLISCKKFCTLVLVLPPT